LFVINFGNLFILFEALFCIYFIDKLSFLYCQFTVLKVGIQILMRYSSLILWTSM